MTKILGKNKNHHQTLNISNDASLILTLASALHYLLTSVVLEGMQTSELRNDRARRPWDLAPGHLLTTSSDRCRRFWLQWGCPVVL